VLDFVVASLHKSSAIGRSVYVQSTPLEQWSLLRGYDIFFVYSLSMHAVSLLGHLFFVLRGA